MKTLFASALIALTFGASSISQAADNKDIAEKKSTYQSVVYPVINTSKIRVNVSKEKDAKVNVSVKNEAGETLVSQQLGKGHESSSIRFDLNELQDGVYQVVISDGTTKQVKEVKLETKTPAAETGRTINMN